MICYTPGIGLANPLIKCNDIAMNEDNSDYKPVKIYKQEMNRFDHYAVAYIPIKTAKKVFNTEKIGKILKFTTQVEKEHNLGNVKELKTDYDFSPEMVDIDMSVEIKAVILYSLL